MTQSLRLTVVGVEEIENANSTTNGPDRCADPNSV